MPAHSNVWILIKTTGTPGISARSSTTQIGKFRKYTQQTFISLHFDNNKIINDNLKQKKFHLKAVFITAFLWPGFGFRHRQTDFAKLEANESHEKISIPWQHWSNSPPRSYFLGMLRLRKPASNYSETFHSKCWIAPSFVLYVNFEMYYAIMSVYRLFARRRHRKRMKNHWQN